MPRGQPPKDTVTIKARIPRELMPRLYLQRPELFKPDLSQTFKHGACARYITSLIKKDLEKS